VRPARACWKFAGAATERLEAKLSPREVATVGAWRERNENRNTGESSALSQTHFVVSATRILSVPAQLLNAMGNVTRRGRIFTEAE
jgi:hypothetical protein